MKDRLGKQLIPTLPEKQFSKMLADIYDAPEDVVPGPGVVCDGRTYYPIGSTHYVVEGPQGWGFFESAEETAWREHVTAWADFARGYWRPGPPTKPGTYPVRNRSGHRTRDHVVIQRGDRVLDVDSGYVAPGRVTNFVGDWWSLPYPSLPGAV